MNIQLTITLGPGDEPLAKTPEQIAVAARKAVGGGSDDTVTVQVNAYASLPISPRPPLTGTMPVEGGGD